MRLNPVYLEAMRLWTVQGEAHWHDSVERGRLTGGTGEHVDPDFKPAYAWMVRQMAQRIPNFTGEYPIWAWPEGEHVYDPEGGWGAAGERFVRVEFEVPDERVLISGFMPWHAVLAGNPVDCDENDPRIKIPLEESMLSWPLVFEPQHPVCVDWGDLLQACVDGVNLPSEVRSVSYFVAVDAPDGDGGEDN